MRYYNDWTTVLQGDYDLETKLVVTDESASDPTPVEYTRITAPIIDRTLNGDCLGIGGVNSASLSVSILTEDTIPKGAKIEVMGRARNANTTTEWIPFGTFWVDRQTTGYESYTIDGNTQGKLVTITAYDALLRANTTFNYGSEVLQPKQMVDIVNDVATRIGVQVDERTVIKADDESEDPQDVKKYAMLPPTDMLMSEALKYIGQINAGNWIITEGNELRLVPLFGASNDSATVDAVLGKYTQGLPQVVSRIVFSDNNGNTYSIGSNAGFVIDVQNPYSIDEYVSSLSYLIGQNYYPYSITNAIITPLFELGDVINIDGYVSSIVNARLRLDTMFRVDLTAPAGTQQSEYPFQPRYVQLINEAKRAVEQSITDLNEDVNGDDENSVRSMLAQINTTLSDINFNYVSQGELHSYINFDATGITLGNVNSPIKVKISSDPNNLGMFFYSGEDENATYEKAIAYFSDDQLHVNNVVTYRTLRIGDSDNQYYWQIEESNKSLSLVYAQ